VEGGRPVTDADEGGRADVVVIDEVDTCLEANLDGEAVVDLTPARGGVAGVALVRGGVDGPALALGRVTLAALAVLEARRETEAVEACFAPIGRVYLSASLVHTQ
jgi:hypothetical protein